MSQSLHKLILIIMILTGILVISGCKFPFSGGADTETDASDAMTMIDSPQAARDVGMVYIRDHFGLFVPTKEGAWSEASITPEGVVGSSAYQYTSGDWSISVIFPIVALENTIYTLLVTNHAMDFAWEGQVDAFGQISEVSSTTHLKENQISETMTPTPTLLPSATLTPRSTTLTFTDDTYRLSFNYPSEWSLTVASAGSITSTGGFASKTVKLSRGETTLNIQYKFLWENTELGASLPDGEIEVRGFATLLEQEIPKHVLVQDGKDKIVFFGDSIDDISYHFHLETRGAELSPEAQEIASQVSQAVQRTGDIIPSPTPTLTPTITPSPTPTSALDYSKSGVGAGSTVDLNCNMADFVAHVTVSEGAGIPPGAQFTKTWRLKNIGTCVWTTSYSIAYSDGDLMGAKETTALTEEASPGETGDISVVFTAPDEVGTYTGYWVLHDSQGYWFGLGETKRGLIPIEINVVKPDEAFAYDFALNYCDATWKSFWESDGETKSTTIACPGSTTSGQGFVTLVVDPNMEHRQDDERTLWVHPYEQRYAWIQGTFPELVVQNGDRFKAAVGCMADMAGCSLDFQLLYKDSDGDIQTKADWEWEETFDGEATYISIDLSSLAGETVQFILKTVATTQNTDVAHGFWFVPRIDRP